MQTRLIVILATLLITGCAAVRLRDNTVAVSATTTDIYYQMVLQNLARAYAEPNVLPWGVELASGSIGVNDTEQLMGGYSETYPMVTPSGSAMVNRALQQSWTTAPITNEAALFALQTYYGAVVSYAKGKTKRDSVSITSTPSVTTATQLINYVTNSTTNPAIPIPNPSGDNFVTNSVGTPAHGQSPQLHISGITSGVAAIPAPVQIQPPTNNAPGTVFSTVTQTTSSTAPPQALGAISVTCFHFRTGNPPANTISAMYGNTSVYVDKDDPVAMKNFTKFTLLILATIDQVPPKAPSGTTSVGPAPLPFFQ